LCKIAIQAAGKALNAQHPPPFLRMNEPGQILEKTSCYHCGDECRAGEIALAEKSFCCHGCKTVYEIISGSELCEYYDLEKNPGISQKIKVRPGKFAFLDDASVTEKLVHFTDGRQSHVTFYLPQMHCSSCIWLLEHLPKLNRAIVRSEVNFLKKEITVVYETACASLKDVAELLTSVGYEPHISLNEISSDKIRKYDRSHIYRIGVAGFCFGNIMMLSFPEYFSGGGELDAGLKHAFSYLNLLLALPVFFYSSSGFFISSWKSLRQRFLNIDAPIALAIVITFGRSVYEILMGTGAGYLDSMAGIVFFMLLGRFFQDRTYQTLSFDRDYTSYFPLGVTLVSEDGSLAQVPVSGLGAGQRIKVHSNEIVPADAILFSGKAQIDYSFVTGESIPVEKGIGEIIYAGGKQVGGALELEVIKSVSQSYLTQLWNNKAFKAAGGEKEVSFIHALSRYFTYVLFSIAAASAIYWQLNDTSRLWPAVTAILIVACPCALLLSANFTNGNMLRQLQKAGFYVRNANALERLSGVDTLVFDKTGTLTEQREAFITYSGSDLSPGEQQLVRSLAGQSSHPLSFAIVSYLPFSKSLQAAKYAEEKGRGAGGTIGGHRVRLGSAEYISGGNAELPRDGSKILVEIDGQLKGYFSVRTAYRENLPGLINRLRLRYDLCLLSGDNNAEEAKMRALFGPGARLLFNQKPEEKLAFVRQLQQEGRKVIMLGDGLNDAGALMQSNAGIVVSDNINNFTPACDAILEGQSLSRVKELLDYCRREKPIIGGSFVLSILYNLAGLYYAVQGTLEPVIAAVLMPLSSVSIVLFTTALSSWLARPLRRPR
jgi:P-type Cu+ transporter